MVTELLQQAPYWTAMRCRPVFWQDLGDQLVVDAVMSAHQPDPGDWDLGAGSPIAVIIAVPSQPWLRAARPVLDLWVREGREIEIRRTRAWEVASQVVLWAPDASLLVTLDG